MDKSSGTDIETHCSKWKIQGRGWKLNFRSPGLISGVMTTTLLRLGCFTGCFTGCNQFLRIYTHSDEKRRVSDNLYISTQDWPKKDTRKSAGYRSTRQTYRPWSHWCPKLRLKPCETVGLNISSWGFIHIFWWEETSFWQLIHISTADTCKNCAKCGKGFKIGTNEAYNMKIKIRLGDISKIFCVCSHANMAASDNCKGISLKKKFLKKFLLNVTN